MTFKEWKEARAQISARIVSARDALQAVCNELAEFEKTVWLKFTFASGTRVIAAFHENNERPQFTMTDDNGFLSIAMLSAQDMKELAELKSAIDHWKSGDLKELPRPKKPFDVWVCPKEMT